MTYKDHFNELLLENPTCRGRLICCQGNRGLTPSHLIARSKRKDLQDEKKNITVHCLYCHMEWEHQTPLIFLMQDFKENMERIKEMDELYYNRLTERHKNMNYGISKRL